MIAKIGENMSLRPAAGVTVGNGVVCSYIHNQTAPGAGKIGALIGLESGGDKAKLEALGTQPAMHVAALRPLALDRRGVDETGRASCSAHVCHDVLIYEVAVISKK